MKIGIMGGTFDPIHNGHLMLGEFAYRKKHLDEVWFMPNGNPPHKKSSSIISDAKQRAKMTELAIDGTTYFKVNLHEVNHTGISCTYQTLEHMHRMYPEDKFYFIIGADSLFSIENWVKPERIFPTCTILAAYRDAIDTEEEMYKQIDHLVQKYDAKIELLETPLMHVSSHELRDKLKNQEPVSDYIPTAVVQYIFEHRLYDER